MPEKKKPHPLRLIIPLAMLVISGAMLVLIVRNSTRPKPAPVTPAPVVTPGPEVSPPEGLPGPAPVASAPAAGAIEGLVARVVGVGAEFTPLEGDHAVHLEFTPIGAGVRRATLHDYHPKAGSPEPVRVQEEAARTLANGQGVVVSPLGAMSVQVNGTWVSVAWSAGGAVWRETAPGSFEAFIDSVLEGEARPVLRLTRTFERVSGTHSVVVRQAAQNLTGEPLEVRLEQFGPIELEGKRTDYGGDKRRVRFGYLLGPVIDPMRQYVQASDFLWAKPRALGSRVKGAGYAPVAPVWPNERSLERSYTLAWAGMHNRHFAACVYPLVEEASPREWWQIERVERVLLDPGGEDPVMILKLTTRSMRLSPAGSEGNSGDLSFGVYLGPLSKRVLRADAPASRVNLRSIVVYNFGGWCGTYCTFAWVTLLLEGLLHLLHDYVVFDWGLAIIVLVLIVRTCLHPVTKWSQIRMQRFGKQMQDLAPKQKMIQERYAGDQAKIREETQRLWREEGVNPAGMLGCLPMFLQTPIWIALYATLYFAFELRQVPAFFGLFQAVTGGHWTFLADLSEPDGAIPFGTSIHIPLLSRLMGEVTGINIMPLILGVVFFVHQKYLTPPTTATLTPEQRQQQQMVKVISVVLFPLFMYNAPSGLSLYFITNSTLAIFESRWIRAHIDRHKLLEVKPRAKGKKPTGFLARLQAAATERARLVEQAKKRQGKGR